MYNIKNKNKKRLIIFRTSRHMYAQIIFNNITLISASTLENKINKKLNFTGNSYASSIIGKIIAKRCINKGIKKIFFDRSKYKYHGRIKTFVIAAREFGLLI